MITLLRNLSQRIYKRGEDKGNQEDRGPIWIKNAESEENDRYRKFLAYCEERREELRLKNEEDEARFKEARGKKDAWELLRLSVELLKERATVLANRKWQSTKESRRTKMKKKRYGIPKAV